MVRPVESWEHFGELSPAVRAPKRPAEGAQLATQFGFVLNSHGYAIPFGAELDDSDIARLRQELEMPEWQPVMARDKLPGFFELEGFNLSSHGMLVAGDSRLPARAMFWLTAEHMCGVAREGSVLSRGDDEWTTVQLCDSVRIWRWDLADIERISVSRVKKLFKLVDEELHIVGRRPAEGSRGAKAGVSVKDWLGGANPEESTATSTSVFSIEGIRAVDADLTDSDGSAMLAIAERLADLVGKRSGRSGTWQVDAERGQKGHRIDFSS